MKEIKQKVSDAIEKLLEDSMGHAIAGAGNILHSPSEGYKQREMLLKVKLEAMAKLEDQLTLGMIDEEEAKNEFIRIKFMEVK